MNVKNILKIVLAVALASIVSIVLIATKPNVVHEADQLPSRLVETITAAEIPFSPQVTAYGIVEPAITLNSTAEVSGRISYVHPALKAGSSIPANTVVVKIESDDYEVSLKQAQADVVANKASLRELDAEEASARRALELAMQNLRVGEAEYARIKAVYEQQVVTKSTLDAEEQKVIGLQQSVEDLQGRIDGFDSRRQSINSQINRAEQAVRNAETILKRTEISLPFGARIGDVNVDVGEFVAVGAQLFEAIDLNGVEINAQLSVAAMGRLVSQIAVPSTLEASTERFISSAGRINDALNLETRVTLVNDSTTAVWDARVLRVSDSIDATRQTLGVVVGIENPFQQVIPGERPPLIKGMYTEVQIVAPTRPAMVLPRKAVHQGRVYTVNAENRLEIRPVEIELVQGDLVVVRTGISDGDRIIITDLSPVIEGMPLEAIAADSFQRDMHRRANGENPR